MNISTKKTNQMKIKMLFLFLKWGGVWGGGLPPYRACPSPGINITVDSAYMHGLGATG